MGVGAEKILVKDRVWAGAGVMLSTNVPIATVNVTVVVSSAVGHVAIFQRSGTCVYGEGTSIFLGPKATSAVMLSQWENGALLFVWILTIKQFVLFQRYNMIPKF